MPEPRSPKMAWIRAGAALSLGALALSMLGGRRGAARLSARVAGAFLEAWGDRRLENRVARLLARNPATPGSARPGAEDADPVRKAEAARTGIEALFSGRAGRADSTPSRQHPEPM